MAHQPRPVATQFDDDDPMMGAVSSLNIGGELVASGGVSIEQQRTLFGDVITAQPLKKPRDEAGVLKKIDAMAAAMGDRWFFRFPVRDRNATNYIEGPTIKCIDAVVRYYGNCQLGAAIIDRGDHWEIYSRFVDLETGYQLIRPSVHSKGGIALKTKDEGRKLRMALSTGVSLGVRVCVEHALADFVTRAFEGAKQSIVERIGRNLPKARETLLERLNSLGVPGIVERVEYVYQRKVADWLAPDMARIVAEYRAISEGMASIDETWPPPPPSEPKRSDPPTAPSSEFPPPTQADDTGGPAVASDAHPAPPQAQADAPPAPPADEPTHYPHAHSDVPPLWIVGDNVVGMDAINAKLHELLGQATTHDDIDQLEQLNADRIERLGKYRPRWVNAVANKRGSLPPREGA